MLRRLSQLAPSIVIIAICVALFWVTLSFDRVPAAFAQGMQASAMPQLILGLIVFLALIVAFQTLQAEPKEQAPLNWRVWATKAVLIGAAIALEPLGVTITIFCVCLAIPLLWGEQRYANILLFATATPVAVYLVFTGLLQLRLPQGPLAPWLS